MMIPVPYHFRLPDSTQLWKLRYFFAVLCCFMPLFSYSQEVNIKASLDTNTIVIGGQLTMSIEINHPANIKAGWPDVADTFSLMEVISRSSIDTIINHEQNTITVRQKFVLTSFDSGFHVIPPWVFSYVAAGDTADYSAESRPLLITVQSVQVDLAESIKDIKGQVNMPYTWQDALPYLFGILLLAITGWLLYRYFKNRKKGVVKQEVLAPARPAHEIALEQLHELEAAKLWQQGNYKSYYTALSDITRTYIENRWQVNAMEMTTDEILHLAFIRNQPQQVYVDLKYFLEISDLVKFAKLIPVGSENELCMKNAMAFVKANIPVREEKEAVI